MAGITGRNFGNELAKLWGFGNCKDIKIHIPISGLVEITALFNMTTEQGKGLAEVIKKYNLEEVIEKKEVK